MNARYLPSLVALAVLTLSGCSTVTHRVVIPRPAPTVDPVRQSIGKAQAHAQQASLSAAKAKTGIEAAKAIAAQLEAGRPAQTEPILKLKAALSQAGRDVSFAQDQADASAAESQTSKAAADALQKQISVQTSDLNQARQVIADQQDTIAKVEKHDAATAAGNRKLIFKIMIYRVIAAIFTGWIASKFVPMLFPQFKLYAALGGGAATLGFLCWLL